MDNKIWDDLAVDYEKSVEDNPNSIIITYLKNEIEILTTLCKKIFESNHDCSIIDMGAGTGRVIFALDKNLHKNSVQFFGIEGSESMLNRANQKNHNHKGISYIEFLKFD